MTPESSLPARIVRLLRYDLPLHVALRLTNWLPDNVPFLRLRGAVAGLFLGQCGRNFRLGRNVSFYNAERIRVADDVYVAYGCWFSATDSIEIGSEAVLGPYCVVVSSSHTREGGSFRYGEARAARTRIGAGAWLAAHVTVSAGSTVGKGSLVGANSVVLGELPADVFAAGAPARVLRRLSDGQED